MPSKLTRLVSIVIPTYNYAHFLSESIESVLSQTYGNLELIIVDNFSTDHTEDLVKSFDDARIKFFQYENSGSIAAARNFGWSRATGHVVAFLDADDSWHPKKLSLQMSRHTSNYGISHHDLRLFGNRGFGRAKGRRVKGKPVVEMLTGGNPILTSSVLINRHLLESSGGFPENLEIVSAEDLALWLRIGELGAEFVYIPKALGRYRLHESSSSSGRSALAAKLVTNEYREILSKKQAARLDGWMAYAQGISAISKRDKRLQFVEALLKSNFRYKWRASLRIIIPNAWN